MWRLPEEGFVPLEEIRLTVRFQRSRSNVNCSSASRRFHVKHYSARSCVSRETRQGRATVPRRLRKWAAIAANAAGVMPWIRDAAPSYLASCDRIKLPAVSSAESPSISPNETSRKSTASSRSACANIRLLPRQVAVVADFGLQLGQRRGGDFRSQGNAAARRSSPTPL